MKKSFLFIQFSLIFLFIYSCTSAQDSANVTDPEVNQDIAVWTNISTNHPSMTSAYAMAYDTDNKKIIVYGGRYVNFNTVTNTWADSVVNETWSFDYETSIWKNLNPATLPPWRVSNKMVYSTVSKKMIMFGGDNFSKSFNDLWEYDFEQNTWTELLPDNPPDAREMHGLSYIPDQDAIIMFGGRRTNGGAEFNDIWKYIYGTNKWNELNPPNNPPSYDHVDIIYYRSVNKIILITPGDAKTWAYDLDNNIWTDLNTSDSPQTGHYSLVYDPINDKAILFGFSSNPSGMVTYKFDYLENSWTNITPNNMPGPELIEHTRMVYINDNNVFIEYGGHLTYATLELKLRK